MFSNVCSRKNRVFTRQMGKRIAILVFIWVVATFGQSAIDTQAVAIMGASVKLVEKVDICCPIDIAAVAAHDSFAGATIVGNFIYFDRTFTYFHADSCFWDGTCRPRHLLDGVTDSVRYRFALHNSGNIYCGVYNQAQALLAVADFQLETATTWARPLTTDDIITGEAHRLDFSQNFLAVLLLHTYIRITDFELLEDDCALEILRDRLCYDAPTDSSGEKLYGFNLLDFSIYSNFSKPLWLMYSRLAFYPMDALYGACWYNGLPVSTGPDARNQIAQNIIWCARCTDSLGGAAIGIQYRGFRVGYLNNIASAIRSRGGSNATTRAYCHLDGVQRMSIVDCCTRDYATANYFAFDTYPDSVRLTTNNTGATQRGIAASFRMAVLADSVWTYALWQNPSPGFSSNTPPYLIKVAPGWNGKAKPELLLTLPESVYVGDFCSGDTFRLVIPISNIGGDTLFITEIQISDTTSASSTYDRSIPPMHSDSIVITFNYEFPDTGVFENLVSIYSNSRCAPLRYIRAYGVIENCLACSTLVDSLRFAEEIDCDEQNIVQICYKLNPTCPESLTDVTVRLSPDSGSTWVVAGDGFFLTLSDTTGDLHHVGAGTHCFNWLLSNDFLTESRSWVLAVGTRWDEDTFFAPLDSRSPRLSLSCPSATVDSGAIVHVSWSIDELFRASFPDTLVIEYGTTRESRAVTGGSFDFPAPPTCDTLVLTVAARDSFCNWGRQTCTFSVCKPFAARVLCPAALSFSACSTQTVSFSIVDTVCGVAAIDTLRTFFTARIFHSDGRLDIMQLSEVLTPASLSFINMLDSMVVHIGSLPLTSGDSVGILLDSLFTTRGCRTTPH